MEFAGARGYSFEDDARAMDWNVSARMGSPYVKLFEEERDAKIFLIVDRSLSMLTGLSPRSRRETSAECAALLALAARINGAGAGMVSFDSEIRVALPPKNSEKQTMAILAALDDDGVRGKGGSALEAAMDGALKILRSRSLVFILSDFRCANYEGALARLARKHDVVAARVVDKMDREIPVAARAVFRDAESGARLALPAFSKRFKKEWKERDKSLIENWSAACSRSGAETELIWTDRDTLPPLLEIFSRRGKTT